MIEIKEVFDLYVIWKVRRYKEILYLLVISINVYPFIEALKVFDRFSKLLGLKPIQQIVKQREFYKRS